MFQNPERQKTEEFSIEQQPKHRKLDKSSSVFASKIPRIIDSASNNINEMVGPGTYDFPSLSKQKSKQKLPKIITIKSD